MKQYGSFHIKPEPGKEPKRIFPPLYGSGRCSCFGSGSVQCETPLSSHWTHFQFKQPDWKLTHSCTSQWDQKTCGPSNWYRFRILIWKNFRQNDDSAAIILCHLQDFNTHTQPVGCDRNTRPPTHPRNVEDRVEGGAKKLWSEKKLEDLVYCYSFISINSIAWLFYMYVFYIYAQVE